MKALFKLRPGRHLKVFLLPLFAAAVFVLLGCGEKAEKPPEEGSKVAVKVGKEREVLYTVVTSRRLNSSDPEDQGYLTGQSPAGRGNSFLAVFIRIQNSSDFAYRPTSAIEVVDSEARRFRPVEAAESAFALDFNQSIAAGETAPAPDSPAAAGLVKGALVLFKIPDSALRSHPVELEIPQLDSDPARIELDV